MNRCCASPFVCHTLRQRKEKAPTEKGNTARYQLAGTGGDSGQQTGVRLKEAGQTVTATVTWDERATAFIGAITVPEQGPITWSKAAYKNADFSVDRGLWLRMATRVTKPAY
jgi:hypothetical protein